MATLVLIPQPDKTITQITFDVCKDRSHESAADITDQAVETGPDTSDHIRPKPDTLSLEIMLSDHAITAFPDFNEGVSAGNVKVDLGGGQGALVLKHDRNTSRPKRIYAELIRCQDEGVLIEVITPNDRYPSMGVQLVGKSENAENGRGWFIRVELREIRVVKTQTAASTVPLRPRGARNRRIGSQNGTEDGAGDSGGTRSILRNLIGG